MKKFIFTSIAFLSAMGLQAAVTLTEGGVTYTVTSSSSSTSSTSSSTSTTINVNNATSGIITYTKAVTATETVTNIYHAYPSKLSNGVSSVNVINFMQQSTASPVTTGSVSSTTAYTIGSTEYANYMSEVAAAVDTIYSYSEVAALNDGARYYYYTYDSDWEEWNKLNVKSLEDLQSNYSNYSTAYYYKTTVNGKIVYYAIYTVNEGEQETMTTTTLDLCTVDSIPYGAFVNKTDLVFIKIGNSISNIADGAFYGASNLATIQLEEGSSFVYSDGILYNSSQDTIKVASCDVATQTIPSTVTTICDGAFYNTKNSITITSMNSSLSVGEYQGSNVTFVTPSTSLTVTSASNGGYTVEGNITNSNIGTISIQGTYMDFTGATIMEDLSISNSTNTLLYFPSGVSVSGTNVIIGSTCENFVLQDGSTFYCPKAFTATNASYSRTFTSQYVTTCLPFDVSASQLNENLVLGGLTSYADNTFTFTYANSIGANIPYLVKSATDSYTLSLTSADVKVYATGTQIVTKGDASFCGIYETTTRTCSEDTYYYGIKVVDDKSQIFKLNGATINPFRAYLSIPASAVTSSAAKFRLVDAIDQEIESFEMEVEDTSAIDQVNSDSNEETIYNLNGQILNKTNRGLNIVNGKLVINK